MARRGPVCDDRDVLACPACSARLTPTRAREGVVYGCGACGGRAATFRALRRYATIAACDGLKAVARRADASPSVLACPACARGMVLASARHVGVERLLDVCPRCDLVWFPEGDLSPLPRPARSSGAAAAPGGSDAAADEARVVRARSPSPFADPPPARLGDVPVWLGGPVELEPIRRATRPFATWAILFGLVVGAVASIAFDAASFEAYRGVGRHRYNPLSLLAALFTWKPSEFALDHLVLVASDPWRDHGGRLLGAFFAQASPWAALAYGFWFWVFADDVEALLGRVRFLALVFGATAAALLVAANDPPHDVPVFYGATAGLAAVVACYAVMLPRVQIGFFGRRADPAVRIPAWLAPAGLALAVAVLRLVEAKEARLVLFTVGTAIGAGAGFLARRSKGAPA